MTNQQCVSLPQNQLLFIKVHLFSVKNILTNLFLHLEVLLKLSQIIDSSLIFYIKFSTYNLS